MIAPRDGGFTLVEVLVAVVLLGIIAPAFASFLIVTLRTTAAAEEALVELGRARLVVAKVERTVGGCTNEELAEDGAPYLEAGDTVVALELVDGAPPACLFEVTAGDVELAGVREVGP